LETNLNTIHFNFVCFVCWASLLDAAIAEFKPTQQPYISLKVGDELRIIEEYDGKWFRGTNVSTKELGVFPASFAHLKLEEEPVKRELSETVKEWLTLLRQSFCVRISYFNVPHGWLPLASLRDLSILRLALYIVAIQLRILVSRVPLYTGNNFPKFLTTRQSKFSAPLTFAPKPACSAKMFFGRPQTPTSIAKLGVICLGIVFLYF
jgi:hypothetical protein